MQEIQVNATKKTKTGSASSTNVHISNVIRQKPRFSSCSVDVLTVTSLLRSCLPYPLEESKLTQFLSLQFCKCIED